MDYNDFDISFNLSLEVPKEILNKRSYKYPHDNFHLFPCKNGENCVLMPVVLDGNYKIKEFLERFEHCDILKLDLSNCKDIKNTYNLIDFPKFNLEFCDIGYSDKIIKIDVIVEN